MRKVIGLITLICLSFILVGCNENYSSYTFHQDSDHQPVIQEEVLNWDLDKVDDKYQLVFTTKTTDTLVEIREDENTSSDEITSYIGVANYNGISVKAYVIENESGLSGLFANDEGEVIIQFALKK